MSTRSSASSPTARRARPGRRGRRDPLGGATARPAQPVQIAVRPRPSSSGSLAGLGRGRSTSCHALGGPDWLPHVSWWWVAPGSSSAQPAGTDRPEVAVARLLLRDLDRASIRAAGRCTFDCRRRGGRRRLRCGQPVCAPFIPYYARLLGAKVARGVDLHAVPPVTGLLTLGRGRRSSRRSTCPGTGSTATCCASDGSASEPAPASARAASSCRARGSARTPKWSPAVRSRARCPPGSCGVVPPASG